MHLELLPVGPPDRYAIARLYEGPLPPILADGIPSGKFVWMCVVRIHDGAVEIKAAQTKPPGDSWRFLFKAAGALGSAICWDREEGDQIRRFEQPTR